MLAIISTSSLVVVHIPWGDRIGLIPGSRRAFDTDTYCFAVQSLAKGTDEFAAEPRIGTSL